MRYLLIAFSVLSASSASAQALDSDFVFGRDYTFERKVAVRSVADAQDSGSITLTSYVYRPLKNDRRQVVLFSHGSTGGLITAPKEPAVPPQPLVRFFVSRGFTVVAPQRRGRGESSGSYVEECSVFLGQCTAADQVPLSARAIAEALRDTDAVLDQIVIGQLVPRDARIIAAGHSRGGFLSLMLAGHRPDLVAAVINYSGGWHGVTDRLTESERRNRMTDHTGRLQQAAQRSSSPTFWVYASRDPLYQDSVPAALVRAWRQAGGNAEFLYVTEHALPNAHLTPQAPAIWSREIDAFLKTIEHR